MRKQRNKRGKLSRNKRVQVIIESPFRATSTAKANPRYPGRKTIVHAVTGKP
jgi:hypothetical protein